MRFFYVLVIAISSQFIQAQEANVFIDLGIKKYVGKVNELDRDRYFGIQASFMSNDLSDEAPYLINDLNTHFAKDINGPQTAANLKIVSVKQAADIGTEFAEKNQQNIGFKNNSFLLTQEAKKVFEVDADFTKTAAKITKYINAAYKTTLPKYYDLMQNPFAENAFKEKQSTLSREKISAYYNKVIPRLKKDFTSIKFGGFSSERPNFEADGFKNWTETHKLFLDIAGEKIDYISLGLYDEVNPKTQTLNYCSGSNLEATLDLLETYSFNKWNKIKPFLISDYGLKVPSWEGAPYSDQKDTFTIESLNKIITALLDKPDRIEKAIPYILGSANEFYNDKTINPDGNSHPFALTRKLEDGSYAYTHLVKFYEFWKDVEGERTYVSSDNPDIQANAFVKDGKWYIIFNNLSDGSNVVNFNFSPVDTDVITKYTLRRLFMNAKGVPELTEAFTDLVIDQWEMEANETLMLVCDVPKEIEYATSIVEYNNYSKQYLKDIEASKPLNFTIDNVKTGKGKAYIRLSIGRDHNLDLNPIVKINDNVVLTPKNWAGDDQKSREDFFGMINIPVPMSYIKETNNIEVKFANGGGKVSSVVLNTEIFSDDVNNKNYKETTAVVYSSHGGNLLNVSTKLVCKSPRITDSKGNTVKKLKSYISGDTIDISTLKGGEYFLESTDGNKYKFKK